MPVTRAQTSVAIATQGTARGPRRTNAIEPVARPLNAPITPPETAPAPDAAKHLTRGQLRDVPFTIGATNAPRPAAITDTKTIADTSRGDMLITLADSSKLPQNRAPTQSQAE